MNEITRDIDLDFLFDVYVAPHDPDVRRQDVGSARLTGDLASVYRLELFHDKKPTGKPFSVICPTL